MDVSSCAQSRVSILVANIVNCLALASSPSFCETAAAMDSAFAIIQCSSGVYIIVNCIAIEFFIVLGSKPTAKLLAQPSRAEWHQ
ncbi:MAG TPA: hypothetical protein PK228_20265, partial [Saprospiraceae bacterium]|nr:hypothetical protein [Saprospiraceae bacterium]